MQKWEYIVIRGINEEIQPYLNKKGEEGWELVSATIDELCCVLFLKRSKGE